MEPLQGGAVPVLLWDIKRRDERSLDIYEGRPDFYRKEIHPAMVCIMNSDHEFGAPSNHYYNAIHEGYKSAGFDVNYLDKAVAQN